MTRRAARKDKNHNQIADELRQAGFRVLDLYQVGDGCPDMLVCGHGRQVLVEIKSDRGKLTAQEGLFFASWDIGLVMIARSAEDVIEWFNYDERIE
jgi:hypothetical protein